MQGRPQPQEPESLDRTGASGLVFLGPEEAATPLVLWEGEGLCVLAVGAAPSSDDDGADVSAERWRCVFLSPVLNHPPTFFV